MTALKKYEKLESSGLWRESLATQRREVIVSFGDTSLVIRNNAEDPIAHWSLPAVQRLNPGQQPAVFSPNAEANETLEIDDSTMVEAIEAVRNAINRRRPHPGRLRLSILLGLTLIILALAVFWLPAALESHTAKVVPFETRAQIGKQVLAQISRLSGNVCKTPAGNRALSRLETRLKVNPRGQIAILPGGIAKSAHLPGSIVLLNRALLEDHELPEVAASYVMVEILRIQKRDPMLDMLQFVGGIASFRLLTTGALDDTSLRNYAQFVLTAKRDLPPFADILAALKEARFSSAPMAYEIDISGETTLPLIEADPFRNINYPRLISDADWISLQSICGG